MTIAVPEFSFPRQDVGCWLGWGREWSVPEIPEGISVVGDERLTAFTVAPEAGRAVIQAYSDDTRERYIAARIGEKGPVLATQKVSGIGIYSSNSTYVAEVEQYEDGTRLYEMLVVKIRIGRTWS